MANKDNLKNAAKTQPIIKKRDVPPIGDNGLADLDIKKTETKEANKEINDKSSIENTETNEISKENNDYKAINTRINNQELTNTAENVVMTEKKTETVPNTYEKRGPGKPKKRKDGDKKISFWLDEDLVSGMYKNLSYGESAGELINTAIREYQKNHNTYGI